MEETRSFGYVCPDCGKAVMGRRGRFALMAAAARIECECGKSTMEVQTDGRRFRLWVPCGICGGTHQAECSLESVLEGRGIGLSCPEKKELCCYVGEEGQVAAALEELAIRCAKEKSGEEAAFTDNVIMYEVLSELKEIAGRDGISCTCGSHRYRMRVHRGAVELICGDCGGRLWLNAATDEDLDRLCCQLKLTIRGK